MLFNSLNFVVFFALVYAVYINLGHRWQNRFLLLASCYFYGSWSWKFFGLLAASITVDYNAARLIEAQRNPRTRKLLMILSVVVNLGFLGFFKYYNFFVDNMAALLAQLGVNAAWLHLDLVLPIGISFYTFHSMSYVIDVYHGKLTASRSYSDFALFVTYFPQLVAGPIARGPQLLPQVQHPRHITPAQLESGLFLFVWGLFKKVIVADGCATVANAVFAHDAQFGGVDKLLGIYAFAFQIYGDFSGYSDMARGLGKMMGFELMLNFNLPYFATNPADFWRRWHISLSTWLRDYLYIPLGGGRGTAWNVYRNLFLTMLLGGIWHGASWTMVLWGAFHGMALIVHRLFKTSDTAPDRPTASWMTAAKIIGMFHVTCLGWLLFRATSLSQVGRFLGDIALNHTVGPNTASYALLILQLAGPMMLFQWMQHRAGTLELFERWTAARRTVFLLAMFWVAIAFFVMNRSVLQGEQPFLYFQF